MLSAEHVLNLPNAFEVAWVYFSFNKINGFVIKFLHCLCLMVTLTSANVWQENEFEMKLTNHACQNGMTTWPDKEGPGKEAASSSHRLDGVMGTVLSGNGFVHWHSPSAMHDLIKSF